MRQTIESAAFESKDTRIPITISCGVAMYTHQLADSAALIEAADEQLYRSKTGGRNRVSFGG
jgi:diguanylate cyclase (GGDEF)-like protein